MVYAMFGCSLWFTGCLVCVSLGVVLARFNLALLGGFRLCAWCGRCFADSSVGADFVGWFGL